MTSEEEKSPLLDNYQPNSVDLRDPREKVRDLYRRHNKLAANGDFYDRDQDINISASTSSLNLVEADHIVAIFVVAFDTRTGNVVEWCKPEDADLEGIEFKAMASGSHTLQKDFVYFRKGCHFGLACFENMPVESDIERGARMKSVGVLATSYTLLYRHMQFLELQVRHLLTYKDRPDVIENSHQLETPGKYGQLKAFFHDKRATIPGSMSLDSLPRPGSAMSTPTNDLLPELKITHPAGCFSQFIKFFSERIFTLWKFALLQKRILFFSPPPIGVVCYRVYCACALANHNIIDLHIGQELQPHFYVNVADIETLETEVSYIACTTEKIFETKTHLYDVYVDNQNINTASQHMKDLLKVSDADRDKYTKLNNQRSAHLFSTEELGDDTDIDEEDVFTSFFTELNNRLLHTLLDVASSQDRQITSDHMRNMGLDPVGDRPFLMELVELYGIDVMLMVDNPCCPR